MTAQELEKLLAQVTPGDWRYSDVTFTSVWGQNDEHIHYTQNGPSALANARLIAMAPTLARRVIAAEKLAEALRGMTKDARECDTEYDGRMYRFCTACREDLDQKDHAEDCDWKVIDAALAAWEAAQ